MKAKLSAVVDETSSASFSARVPAIRLREGVENRASWRASGATSSNRAKRHLHPGRCERDPVQGRETAKDRRFQEDLNAFLQEEGQNFTGIARPWGHAEWVCGCAEKLWQLQVHQPRLLSKMLWLTQPAGQNLRFLNGAPPS